MTAAGSQPRRPPPTYYDLRRADAAVAAAQARPHSTGPGFARLMAAAHARLALERRSHGSEPRPTQQLSLTCCLPTLELEWLLHGPLLGAMAAVLMTPTELGKAGPIHGAEARP